MNEKPIPMEQLYEDLAYAENVANGLILDGSVTYAVKTPTKCKRYGRLVCCADCGSSKKTLFKVVDVYYCKDCKKAHTEN